MNTNIARSLARYIALPVVSAGIIGGAALGLAGVANAGTYSQPSPSIVATADTTAHPVTTATPGGWWHRHHPSLLDPSIAGQFTPPGR